MMANDYERTAQMENKGVSRQGVNVMQEQPAGEPDDLADVHAAPNEVTVKKDRGTDGLDERGDHQKHSHIITWVLQHAIV